MKILHLRIQATVGKILSFMNFKSYFDKTAYFRFLELFYFDWLILTAYKFVSSYFLPRD